MKTAWRGLVLHCGEEKRGKLRGDRRNAVFRTKPRDPLDCVQLVRVLGIRENPPPSKSQFRRNKRASLSAATILLENENLEDTNKHFVIFYDYGTIGATAASPRKGGTSRVMGLIQSNSSLPGRRRFKCTIIRTSQPPILGS